MNLKYIYWKNPWSEVWARTYIFQNCHQVDQNPCSQFRHTSQNLYFFLRLHVHLRKTLRNYLWLNRSLLAIFQDKSWFSIWTELQNFPQMSVSKLLKAWRCLKDLKKDTAYMRPWSKLVSFLLVGCYCCTYIVYMYNWVERPSNGYRKAQKNWFLSTCAPSKKVNVQKRFRITYFIGTKFVFKWRCTLNRRSQGVMDHGGCKWMIWITPSILCLWVGLM